MVSLLFCGGVRGIILRVKRGAPEQVSGKKLGFLRAKKVERKGWRKGTVCGRRFKVKRAPISERKGVRTGEIAPKKRGGVQKGKRRAKKGDKKNGCFFDC